MPAAKRLRLFSAALCLALGALLFTACGPSETEQEEPVGTVGSDSVTHAKLKHEQDSIAATEKVAPSKENSDTVQFDTAAAREVLRMMDSMAALKRK